MKFLYGGHAIYLSNISTAMERRMKNIQALVFLLIIVGAPLFAWYYVGPGTALALAAICALVLIRFRQNIVQSLKGEDTMAGD
jgi:glycerol-3-phosphate acyltransferase PlsY